MKEESAGPDMYHGNVTTEHMSLMRDSWGCVFALGGADEGREQASAERNRCELIATAADCYQFACETGVITPDELFLQSSSLTSSGDCTSDQEGKSAGGGSSKKRKVGDNQDEQGMGSTPPRVLRSLAVVMERYGKFLRYFPFQSLVDGDDDGGMYRDKGKGKGEASRSAHDFAPKPLLDDPGALPPEREATRLARAVLIRRAFNLMAACLSGSDKPNDMAAVLVREGLWGEETQRLVVYSLAWPWAGGLLPRASDGDEVGKCTSGGWGRGGSREIVGVKMSGPSAVAVFFYQTICPRQFPTTRDWETTCEPHVVLVKPII